MFDSAGRREVSRGERGSDPAEPGTTTVVDGGPTRDVSVPGRTVPGVGYGVVDGYGDVPGGYSDAAVEST
jgi:hypothetical protein